jgi:group I intron endonuclease
MTQSGGVYYIEHIPTKRIYVGSTINFHKRFWAHRKMLRTNTHYNVKLQRAWNKHGESDFVFKILETVPIKERILEREQHYLDTLHPHFNIATDAVACMRGRRLTESQRVAHKERMRACAHKIAATLRGRPGRKLSEEAKRQISAKLKGRRHEPDRIAKAAATRRGFKHTDEAKKKIGEASKQRIRKPETKAKVSESIRLWWAKKKQSTSFS